MNFGKVAPSPLVYMLAKFLWSLNYIENKCSDSLVFNRV